MKLLFASILVLFSCSYYVSAVPINHDTLCGEQDTDLMFVIDGSGTIGEHDFGLVKDWIKKFMEDIDLTKNTQVGVVQYSGWYPNRPDNQQPYLKTEIELSHHSDHAEFGSKVDQIVHQGFTTFTAHAIMKTIRDDFNGPSSRYHEGARRIMILLTDGQAHDPELISDATAYAKENGVESFSVGVGDYFMNHMELLVEVAGSEDRVTTISSFDELDGILSALKSQIPCGLEAPAALSAVWTDYEGQGCSATCGEGEEVFLRFCVGDGQCEGDAALVKPCEDLPPCDDCATQDIDLMFVMDGSYTVGVENFTIAKNWVKKVTKGFELTKRTQVGVVQYSGLYPNMDLHQQPYMKTEIELSHFSGQAEFEEYMDRITWQGYTTYTAHAITKTIKYDFNGPNSNYPAAKRVMVLLTDGQNYDDHMIPDAVNLAQENGVEAISVGVGKYFQDHRDGLLLDVAGSKDRVLTVETYDGLDEIISALNLQIPCHPVPEPEPEPAPIVDCFQDGDHDVVFVIDASGTVGEEGFVLIKNWIKDFVGDFDLITHTQVGVVVYSGWYHDSAADDQPYMQTAIELSNFADQEDFKNRVDQIAYQGYSTYTAHAIMKAIRDDFNSPQSNYPAAKRVMILLTDGIADDVDMIPEAVTMAHENGVEAFSVGVGDYFSNHHELLVQVAGSEDRVATVSDFDHLLEITTALKSQIPC